MLLFQSARHAWARWRHGDWTIAVPAGAGLRCSRMESAQDVEPMQGLIVGVTAMQITSITHHRSRMTADDVVSIRIAAAMGVRVRHIARVTKIPRSTVHSIVTGKHHAQVWSERLSVYEDL